MHQCSKQEHGVFAVTRRPWVACRFEPPGTGEAFPLTDFLLEAAFAMGWPKDHLDLDYF